MARALPAKPYPLKGMPNLSSVSDKPNCFPIVRAHFALWCAIIK